MEIRTLTEGGATYRSTTIKVRGIEWGILKVTGKYNYVTIKKITANPHAMLGKEFRTEDQAIANYKSMAMKVALVQTFAEL